MINGLNLRDDAKMLQISITGHIAKATYFPGKTNPNYAAIFILKEEYFNQRAVSERYWAVAVPQHLREALKYHELQKHLVMVVSCDLWPTGENQLHYVQDVPFTVQAIAIQRVSA